MGATSEGTASTTGVSTGAVIHDPAAADRLFQLLARVVRQVHTYPPASPFRAEAIEACRVALLARETSEPLEASVLPMALRVGDHLIGTGTIVEVELARRLSRAGVAGLSVSREVSTRDLVRFSELLVVAQEHFNAGSSLEDRLAEAGVDAITVRTATRPALVRVEVPSPERAAGLERERQRQAAQVGASGHLYPPDKGWIRVDPATPLERISLTELAVLMENPADLAVLLLRMTDDVAPGETPEPGQALNRKYTEIVTLFGALDPGIASAMFARLARAVLHLPTDLRQSLLRRSVLPGLLEGDHDGRILAEFPDVELAESLCLLLDVETAAPELLVTAIDRLNLTEDRRREVAPLVEAELNRRAAAGQQADEAQLDQRAARLVRIDGMTGDSLAEFAAFDLALNDQARAELATVRLAISGEDHSPAALRCLLNLIRLEANPSLTEGYLAALLQILTERWQARHWAAMAEAITTLGGIQVGVAESRPDVAAAIDTGLRAWCSAGMLESAVNAAVGTGPDALDAQALLAAMAPVSGPAAAELIGRLQDGPAREALFAALTPHASVMAPALAVGLDDLSGAAARGVIRLLGAAGPGQEHAVGRRLADRDGNTVREALHAMAEMGSPTAAKLVAERLMEGPDAEVSGAAITALFKFSPEVARPSLRRLLAPDALPRRHSGLALKLLERLPAVQARPLQPELERLARWPARFWSPAAFQIRGRARRLLG